MIIDEYINYFMKSKLVEIGFEIIIDIENNISLIKKEESRILKIGVPYSRDNYNLYSPNWSISFILLQKLYADLCYPAIQRNNCFEPDQNWLREQYEYPTIICGAKIDTMNGVLFSKFKCLSIADFSGDLSKEYINNINVYVDYLNKSYWNTDKHFYSIVKTEVDLNNLTHNLNLYELSLYLTGIPPLKKIVLMGIVEDTTITEYISNYENTLKSISRNVVIDSILTSLANIKSYFDVRC